MPAFDLALGSAYIIITSSTAFTWSILVLLIRIFLRVKVNGPFGLDDVTCAVATVSLCCCGISTEQHAEKICAKKLFGIVAAILAVIEAHLGLGGDLKAISPSSGNEIQLLAYIVIFCYVIGLHLSQLSTCFLMARITKMGRQVWISYSIALVSGSLAVAYVFAMAFRCKLPTPWIKMQETNQCINQWETWMAYTIVQSLLEIAIVIAAMILVWPLNMRMKSKVIVIAAFSVRLLVIPPAVVRLKYTYMALYGSDWARDRVNTVFITQIVLHLSIILATLPCIKPWLTVLEGGGLRISRAATTHLPLTREPVEEQDMVIHMDSIDKWQASLDSRRADHSRTITNVHYDAEDAREAARKRSLDSSESSKNAIRRIDSFKVESFTTPGDLQPAQRASLDASRRSSRITVQTEI